MTNQADGTISVLLGQADGTFVTKGGAVPAGSETYAITTGDFNGDGKVDIAVTNPCGTSCQGVSVLLGKGDGTFQSPVLYQAGGNPFAITALDLNGDGKQDLVVMNVCQAACSPSETGTVSVLLGNGDGTFQAKTDYPVAQTANTMVMADLNGDGNLDVAVSCGSKAISVLFGKGDGTFQPHVDTPTIDIPYTLAVGDFNGDKIPDLVVSYVFLPLGMFVGKGDGTFQAEQQILTPSLAQGIAASMSLGIDLNGDGKSDLVFSGNFEGGAVVMLGNGDGTFQPPLVYSSGFVPLAFAAKDVNGDGNIDLELIDQRLNSVTVLLGNGNGTFSPRFDLPINPLGINLPYGVSGAISDFNGDGIPDLAVANSSGEISMLLGTGKGLYKPPTTFNANGSDSMTVGDFNGDGKKDIVLSNAQGAVYLAGNGDGTFATPTQVLSVSTESYGKLAVGDFNGDGKLDLVVLANGFLQTLPIYVALGNGDGTFQIPRQFWSLVTIPMSIAVGDFNHDGKLDLVASVNPNGIAIMLGNGDGSFQPPVIYATDDVPGQVIVADLNGDGFPDVATYGLTLDVFLGKGDGTFPTRVDYDGGENFFSLIAADVNGDGKLDLVVNGSGSSDPPLEVLLGNGDGTFQPRIEIASGGGFGELAAGDLNQDGSADIVSVGGITSQYLSGPIATIGPTPITFGSVDTGTSTSPTNVTLFNSGNGPLDITSAAVSSGFQLNNGCGATLTIRASCILGVSFSPTTAGSAQGALTITDNAPAGKQLVPLSGIGTADFTLAVSSGSSNSATVTAGGTSQYSLTLGPGGGFVGAVSFAGTGVPAMAGCTVSPASSTLDGKDSVTVNVQVTTTSSSSGIQPPRGPLPLDPFTTPLAILTAMLVILAVILRKASSQQRFAWKQSIALACVLLGALGGMSACGGGGGSGGGGGGSTGTPAGTYTLTVTGSAGSGANVTQHTVALTLVVN